MTLRYLINVRILFFFIIILGIAGWVAIVLARQSVQNEVDASVTMAKQLIQMNLSKTGYVISKDPGWLYQIRKINKTRHLYIRLKQDSGQVTDFINSNELMDSSNQAPKWFINLVSIDYSPVEFRVQDSSGRSHTIQLLAKPIDEINEVWQETLAFFGFLILLVLLTFLVVHLVFNKALKSIDTIVKQLHQIETGEYQVKLPNFVISEYASIANAINHMTDVLAETQKENQALTEHSLKIQEEERQRLSQELHDEIGQLLTAIKVMAVAAEQQPSEISKIKNSISDTCDHLLMIVRTMMQQLHPLMLEDLGLKAALEDLFNRWAEKNPQLQLDLECSDSIDSLSHSVSIQLYRIVQECLTNTVRHANATKVNLSLFWPEQNPNLLTLNYQDNGIGCEIDNMSKGFGLRGMKERTRPLNGKLTITSKRNSGMQVQAEFPITML